MLSSMANSLQSEFENIGGQFLSSLTEMQENIKEIDAFLFDWDGVFNNGIKSSAQGSPFSEADSMGINMLRFSYYLLHGKMPYVGIITGENNQTAVHFAEREHINAVVLKAKNKGEAIGSFCKAYGQESNQCLFVFDDILDISATLRCKMALGVRRAASPLFHNYLIEEQICDYISGNEGGQHAVREICELIIGLQGNYQQTIEARIEFKEEYANYLRMRQDIQPSVNS